MSNALAVAAVTATIQDRILAAATSEVPGASVLAARSDAKLQGDGPSVNVFLYAVVVNPFLSNEPLAPRTAPTRRDDPNPLIPVAVAPVAALDLHYVITFHGKDSSLEPQRMLGAVIADLGGNPVLLRSEIRQSVTTREFLAGADLADQVDRVVLTPIHLSLEETARLWSVMLQEPYSLSLQYVASVVLVTAEPRTALPVTDIAVRTSPGVADAVADVTEFHGARP
ncbi:unnamed protein product [Phaeothamnion confervicola]